MEWANPDERVPEFSLAHAISPSRLPARKTAGPQVEENRITTVRLSYFDFSLQPAMIFSCPKGHREEDLFTIVSDSPTWAVKDFILSGNRRPTRLTCSNGRLSSGTVEDVVIRHDPTFVLRFLGADRWQILADGRVHYEGAIAGGLVPVSLEKPVRDDPREQAPEGAIVILQGIPVPAPSPYNYVDSTDGPEPVDPETDIKSAIKKAATAVVSVEKDSLRFRVRGFLASWKDHHYLISRGGRRK